MERPSDQKRQALVERYPDDPEVLEVVKALEHAEKLLETSLWEFGVEVRADIERYLGEKPLISG